MPRLLRRALTSVAVLALGIGGAVVVTAPAAAATTPVTLPGDADVPGTLRYAVNEANAEPGQSVITIANFLAITLDDTLTLTEGVTITGGEGVVIDRSGSFDFFHITPDPALDDQAYAFEVIQLQGDADTQTGRGIVANTAVPFDSLNTREVRFFELVGDVGSGGAVLVDQAENGPMTFSATSFQGNSAAISGGAVSVTNAASLTFDQFGSVGENTAPIGGGLAANEIAGEVRFDETFFAGNTATGGDGGAVHLHAVGSVTISGPEVSSATENSATGNGGFAAIDDVLGTVAVSDGYYYDNAAANGGALWIEDVANFTITDGLYEANRVTGDGGAVHVTGATTPVITNGTFRSNEALQGRGGGVAIVSTDGGPIATATITGGEFVNNSAFSGGGLALEVTELAVVQGGTLFGDNHALTGNGGGIASSGTVQALQFNGITIENNDALDGAGGGVYIAGAYTTTLSDVDVFTNDAELGGGLYVNVFNTSVLVQDSTFGGNAAQDGSGGGINIQQVDPDDSFTVLRSTFEGNSADGENPVGGAIAVGTNNGTVKVDSSTFHDNLVTSDFGNGRSIGTTQFNSAGGVYDIVNSTFEETENETNAYAISFVGNVGTVLIHSSTITATGGVSFDQNSETATIQNTIIDVVGPLASVFVEPGDNNPVNAAFSLFSDAYNPVAIASEATNRFDVADMRLGPLTDNGGPTETRLPAVNSPAVGNGNAAIDPLLPPTDQRGPGFPRVLGVLDIGAVEIPQPLANTGSTGLPTWVPIVGGIVLLLGVGAVVFSVVNRRKGGAAASTTDAGEPGPGTGGDALFPEASTSPPTAEPPAENDPR